MKLFSDRTRRRLRHLKQERRARTLARGFGMKIQTYPHDDMIKIVYAVGWRDDMDREEYDAYTWGEAIAHLEGSTFECRFGQRLAELFKGSGLGELDT